MNNLTHRRTFQSTHRLLLLVAAVLLVACPTFANGQSTSKSLGSSLKTLGKATIQHCRTKKLTSVGVLKFLIFDDQGKPQHTVGTINSLLADRMEVALVLANRPTDPVTLIEDASSVAAKIEGANHLTKEGRKALLGGDYQPMWGDESVKADLLITGIAEIDSDKQIVTLSLMAFDNNSEDLSAIGEDQIIKLTPTLFAEAGASFTTRGAFDHGKIGGTNAKPVDGSPPTDLPPGEDLAFTSAAKIQTGGKEEHPIYNPNSPVRLQVLYDGVAMAVDVKNGRATIQEPKQGQRVELLIAKDNTPDRYAVVVKLNGRNTLYQQQAPDLGCTKWVLSRPGQSKLIKGFQSRDNQNVELFQILSDQESKKQEMNYGKDVGTISITVFSEGKPAPLELDDEKYDAGLVEASLLPKKKSSTFGALKAKLLASANRGLIVKSNVTTEGRVKAVKFHCGTTPVMSAVIAYYRAK
jgi:hypothetical protein